MPRNPRSNPLALAVLTCLYEKPMHPYEVSQTLKARAKHESIKLNFGSLYAVVEGLEKRGLIQARETVREGRRPERTIYEITDDGAREMSEWLSELLASPAKEFPQFEAALSLLGGLPPDEAADQLERRVDALEMRLVQARAVMEASGRMGLPRLFSLEGEYEINQLEAELGWVRALVTDIRKGQLDGLDEWRSWYEPGQGDLPAITRIADLAAHQAERRRPRALPATTDD